MAYLTCKNGRLTRDEPPEAEVALMQRRLQWFVDQFGITPIDRTLEAINKACATLPGRWTIEIEMERDAGNVCLYDEEGTEHEFPCDRESLGQDIRDALDYAIDQHSAQIEQP